MINAGLAAMQRCKLDEYSDVDLEAITWTAAPALRAPSMAS
jgi:hypothetical protein